MSNSGLTKTTCVALLFLTRNSKLETRNSKLETRNSKLETRNSKLETRNSKLATRLRLLFLIFSTNQNKHSRGNDNSSAKVRCSAWNIAPN